jgi:D-arabinose 1-dehydrogenase-like Zn-dependent alcohol dehydrogenase
MASVTGRAVQVVAAGGDFQLVKKEYPDPGPGQVRIRVQACGVCHSDSVTKYGLFPGIAYPRVPGHEVAGELDAVGADVPLFKKGRRVGLGWHGGHCNYCEPCRRGDFMLCENGQISGIYMDGGWAEYVMAPANALAFIPDELNDVDAAPLLCAGITTYNALRNSGARPGDTVAILGIGGLGHLGVQYAAKSGYRTVAIARGQDKAPLAKRLGAHVYIDTTTHDPAAELQKLGGAKVILSTVTNADALEAAMGGLGPNGKLIINGVPEQPLTAPVMQMIGKRQSLVGWPAGTGMDSEDTLNFSALSGVKPMVETYPLEKAAEAFDRMMSGKARFRVVLTMGHEASPL